MDRTSLKTPRHIGQIRSRDHFSRPISDEYPRSKMDARSMNGNDDDDVHVRGMPIYGNLCRSPGVPVHRVSYNVNLNIGNNNRDAGTPGRRDAGTPLVRRDPMSTFHELPKYRPFFMPSST